MRVNIQKKYLFFREDARAILKNIKRHKGVLKTVYLDFSQVHFMSRSFADELLNMVKNLQNEGTKLEFQNLDSKLKKMIDHIRKTKTVIQATPFFNIFFLIEILI